MKKILLAFLFSLSISVSVNAAGGDSILGNWVNSDKSIKIQFAKQNDQYYANVIWLSEQTDKEGNPKLDINNPDPNKSKMPIIGLTIVWGLKYDSDRWTDGYVYSPQKGVTVNCKVYIDKEGRLIMAASKFGIKKEKLWVRE